MNQNQDSSPEAGQITDPDDRMNRIGSDKSVNKSENHHHGDHHYRSTNSKDNVGYIKRRRKHKRVKRERRKCPYQRTKKSTVNVRSHYRRLKSFDTSRLTSEESPVFENLKIRCSYR